MSPLAWRTPQVDAAQPAAKTATVANPGPAYKLTVKLLDRAGTPAASVAYRNVFVDNLDDSTVAYQGGPGQISLPAGRYAIRAIIETSRSKRDPSYSVIAYPELRLDRDMVQTLDARTGKRASITVDNPAARGGGYDVITFTKVSDCSCTTSLRINLDPRFDEVYAGTVPGVSSPTFAFGQARRATEPALELSATGSENFEVRVDWLDWNFPAPTDSAAMPAVYGGRGTPQDLAKVEAANKLVLIEVPANLSGPELTARIAAVKDAGAKLAMVVVRGGPASALAQPSQSSLPVLIGLGATAERFAALVKSGGTTIGYASRPMPQMRYELAYGVTDQIATDQVYHPRTPDLAAVRTSYYDGRPDTARFLIASAAFFGSNLRVQFAPRTRVPQERVEYFTPGTWDFYVGSDGSPHLSDTRKLHAGENEPIAWDKAVIGPTLRGTTRTREGEQRPWAWRKDGAVDVILPMFGDSAGHPRMPSSRIGTDTGAISLYRDDLLVRTTPQPEAARIEVPDDPAAYRLTAEVNRSAEWWPLATRVASEWTFQSSAADDGQALPLLTVRLDPAVDLQNRAPAGTISFPVDVERQGMGHIDATSLVVEVSYDDGGTWQPAAVSSAEDRRMVRVDQPGSGYVSLRVTAADADGNSVRQTVIRAYQFGE